MEKELKDLFTALTKPTKNQIDSELLTLTNQKPEGSLDNTIFAPWQGENYLCNVPSAYPNMRIQIVALNNGLFISSPTKHNPLCAIWSTQYESKELALRKAAAFTLSMIRSRHQDHEHRFKLTNEQYKAMIEWVYSILTKPPPKIYTKQPEINAIKKIKPKQIDIFL